MRPEDRNIALLWDIREAAREIVEFMKGNTYHPFTSQKVLRYAVEREMMVIGEAARRVSDSFKDARPEIPWNSMVGQRNVSTNGYGEVLLECIWLGATEGIPKLICLLDPLIPSPPKTDA
jgi:uncharacterized protein with HEPN domain